MLCAEKVSFYFYSLCRTGLIWLFTSSTLALLSFGAHLSIKKWCCHLVRLPICNTIFPWIAEISVPERLCFNSGCFWSVCVFKRMPFPFQIVFVSSPQYPVMRGQDLSAATGYTTQRSSILPLYEVSDPVYGVVLSQNKIQRNMLNVSQIVLTLGSSLPLFSRESFLQIMLKKS